MDNRVFCPTQKETKYDNMKIFGLIGYPLTHSFSPQYFKEKFIRENISDSYYNLYPLESLQSFHTFIKNNSNLHGLNITIPYKKEILSYIDEVDEIALKVKAVNTIKIKREGGKILTKGFNTDIFGFEHALFPLLKNHHKTALVLGNGGASSAIQFVLHKLGIDYYVVSRNPEANIISYSEANQKYLSHTFLIINTTPLGTYPASSTYPLIDYEKLTRNHLLFDLVYNPNETVFMEKAKEKGAFSCNGQRMLELQAEESWRIWMS